MTDQRLPAGGNVRYRWYASNAFANPASPTVAELNSASSVDLATAGSFNDFDFGTQGSDTNNDPALDARLNIATRGRKQYGGSISFYLPTDRSNTADPYVKAWNAFKTLRTSGYIVISIDGTVSDGTTPTIAGNPLRSTFAAGDRVSVYKVITDAWSDVDTGDDSFRYTVTFVPQGVMFPYAIARATTNTVAVTPAAPTLTAVGDIAALKATLNGRVNTFAGVTWTSSAPSIVSVSNIGTIKRLAAGAATITATDVTGATATATVAAAA